MPSVPAITTFFATDIYKTNLCITYIYIYLTLMCVVVVVFVVVVFVVVVCKRERQQVIMTQNSFEILAVSLIYNLYYV